MTKISFGARLLKHQIAYPLCDVDMITTPLEAGPEITKSLNSSGGLWLKGAFTGGSQRGGSAGWLVTTK